MPRKDQGWITFQLTEAERRILESHCEQTHRSKTAVLRELVRTLEKSLANRNPPSDLAAQQSQSEGFRSMRVSARNIFPAIVKQIRCGSINAEILLEIAPNVEAVSVITLSSAEGLQLVQGKQVYAMIKSSNVMVAVDD